MMQMEDEFEGKEDEDPGYYGIPMEHELQMDHPLKAIFLKEELLSPLCQFLSVRDMKALRRVNRVCNSVISSDPTLQGRVQAVMSASWHGKARGMDKDNTLTWKHFALRRFRYYRHSQVFKLYWTHVSGRLTNLSITDSSLECDGFAWILNNSPSLTTLSLHNVKLRDFSYQHSERLAFPHQWAGEGPFDQALRTLSIEKTGDMEPCFMDYLVQRTGQLNSLSLASCFYKEIKGPLHENEKQCLKSRYSKFQTGLVKLLTRNAGSLRKICLKRMANQGAYFKLLKDISLPPLFLRDLHVTFPLEDYNPLFDSANPPNDYFVSFVEYLEDRGRDLTTLSLHFDRPFRNVDLDNLLVPVRKSLVNLSLAFHGDLLATDVELSSLAEMDNLEVLKVRDIKKVVRKDVCLIRAAPKNTILDGQQRIEVMDKLETKVGVGFLARLPPKVTSLVVEGLIKRQEILSMLTDEDLGKSRDSFRNLTSFELFGPWLHGVQTLVPAVVNGMPLLRKLALTDCLLTDVDITGLAPVGVKDLRKCLTHLIPAFFPGGVQVGRDNFETALAHIDLPPAPLRPLLSRLTDLEHLDLSRNRISDVSLIESLNIRGLKTLNLAYCGRITNNGLQLIARNMPVLEEINLKHVRRLSKFGLNRLISSSKKLRRLYTTPKILEMNDGFLDGELSPNYYDVTRVVEEDEEEDEDGEME